MKTNKTKISPIERFQANMTIAFKQYYHQALSDNAKRVWQKRKKLSTR